MDLIQAMRVEYARSKTWFFRATLINAGLYVAAVLSLLVAGWVTQVIGILTVVAQVTYFWLRRVYTQHYSMAERIRRMAMLKDGLEVQPNDLEIAELLDQTGGATDTEAPFSEPYYASTEKVGPRRLIDILRESAFFTRGLAGTCSLVFFLVTAIGFAATVVAGWMLVTMSGVSGPTLELIAQSAVIFMAFWASGDALDVALRFSDLARTTGVILSRCQEALASGRADEKGLALVLLGEYNCAVLEAPPIPNAIYRFRQEKLNYAWRNKGSGK